MFDVLHFVALCVGGLLCWLAGYCLAQAILKPLKSKINDLLDLLDERKAMIEKLINVCSIALAQRDTILEGFALVDPEKAAQVADLLKEQVAHLNPAAADVANAAILKAQEASKPKKNRRRGGKGGDSQPA
ncbi:hypothetical protein GAV44_23320 [Salmonella enterica subsp. enterica serovar Newport]|nr:hypothetical protein [Salmonella enterica subsp. enterica serovar Newport]